MPNLRNRVVGEKYRLIRLIGYGSFGDIYRAVNLQNGEDVAVKIEPPNSPHPQLKYEAHVYKSIQGFGIPMLRYFGVENDYNIMIIDLLGPSLEDLFTYCSLPWQGLKASTKRGKYDRITERKMSTPIEALCMGFPSEFQMFLNYCRGLRFDEDPDYMYLRQLFRILFRSHNYEYDYEFDWTIRKEIEKRALDKTYSIIGNKISTTNNALEVGPGGTTSGAGAIQSPVGPGGGLPQQMIGGGNIVAPNAAATATGPGTEG
ncbi:PREDICTED: casein kinase I-like [Rhagoletis zephyria]|uniref:casein kinase I-like n=1 Tax=Rhagoletis zephyria TaxID=28612 RepID=UPI00081124AA|nr:PREDICTED: casein kinase I-like [Rhagoletis zephyria]